MIDTHCHILPKVDDGPASVEISLEMAAMAAADGIDTVVVSPHIVAGFFDGLDLKHRVAVLQQQIDAQGIKLRLITGAEIPMSFCFSTEASVLKKLSIDGGKYLLIEAANVSYEQIFQSIYQVRIKGLIPVLAHPERTDCVQKNPEQLADKVDSGDFICQLTTAGVEGYLGKTVKKTAMSLIKLDAVHMVASDAHSMNHRLPRLSVSRRIVSDSFGEAAARVLFEENPARLLENLPMRPVIVGKNHTLGKGRGWIRRLRSR